MRQIVKDKIEEMMPDDVRNCGCPECYVKGAEAFAKQSEKLKTTIYSAISKLTTAQQMFMRFADSMYAQEITNQRRELEKAVRAYEEWLSSE